ncbi:hypothetical protein AB9F39_38565, partial [Rhizobium leguminosarum]
CTACLDHTAFVCSQAEAFCETLATKLKQDSRGNVKGVYTDRPGEAIYADVVVLAEGVNGFLGKRGRLRETPKPDSVAL